MGRRKSYDWAALPIIFVIKIFGSRGFDIECYSEFVADWVPSAVFPKRREVGDKTFPS